MEDSIEIKGLTKFYGKKQALLDVNLSIGPGLFGLLGRNGAGKTTLMKTLATLLPKKDGEITVCGIPVEQAKEVRKITGYLPQEFSMYPSMRVAEVMEYLGILCGLSAKERRERTETLLQRVNLTEHKNKKVRALSGGMKRRLGIAQALLNHPRVLIVDEPTAGLDPQERVRFRNLLSEIAEDKIVLLSTHIVGDVEAACEQLAILDEGKVLYKGTVDALVDGARGRVFRRAADKKELARLKRELTITGMHTQGKKTYVRFLAERPSAGDEACEPNIEDAYLLHLYENGSEGLSPEESAGGEA